jgi:hypothetical protein
MLAMRLVARSTFRACALLALGSAAMLLCCADSCRAAGFADLTDRVEVPCAQGANKGDAARGDIVLLTFGQSISANHGESGYTPLGNVVNFNANNGRCYRAKDPLLGASSSPSGQVGSLWGRLCDILLITGFWQRCVIAPIAQGGARMIDWAPGGQWYPLIEQTVRGLQDAQLAPTLLLYGQGEADASVHADALAYQSNFRRMAIATRKLTWAPILVAVETLCYSGGATPDLQPVEPKTRIAKWIGQESIQQAQRGIIDPALKILPGPNLDFINDQIGRWDGCHLSRFGLTAAAEMWAHYVLQATGHLEE